MRVLLSWLREFVDVPAEPGKLGEDLTLVGLAVDGLESDGRDTVLDLDITTNRVDCMNVYGVAREVSVLYDVPLKPLPLATKLRKAAADGLGVEIAARDLCDRFSACVLDVRVGPSPAWLRDRLEKVGVRPISNVVDLTNYVMLEMGQPTHAFDLAKVPGGKLIARWGREREQVKTLDGVDRAVPAAPRVGVVACPEGPLAIAGVMGGASSEVSDATTVVALEAAHWAPLAIRRAAKALGMHTDASHRFERGADPAGTVRAIARIAHLLEKIGAGSARPGLIDRETGWSRARRAPLRHERISAVLGTTVPEASAKRYLKGLGFALGSQSRGRRQVTIPSWRGDVSREADLIEEVGRHHGLDKIPHTLPQAQRAGGLKREQVRERLLRQTLIAAGLTEVINLSFLDSAQLAALHPGPALPLSNPISQEQGVLRTTLAVGLLNSLRVNLRQGRRDVHLFEIGRVFLSGEPRPREEQRLGVLLHGERRARHLSEPARPADFFDLKGLLGALAEAMSLPEFQLTDAGLPFLHPGRSAAVAGPRGGLGWLGALHPDAASAWELTGDVWLLELQVEPLAAAPVQPVHLLPLPRHPAVTRDVSLFCDAATQAASLVEVARSAGGALLRSVDVADRYAGAPVPAGRVSLMLSLRFQDPSRTLTSEEVDASVAAIQSALRAAGAEIRGE